jgi:hypothetical protein
VMKARMHMSAPQSVQVRGKPPRDRRQQHPASPPNGSWSLSLFQELTAAG